VVELSFKTLRYFRIPLKYPPPRGNWGIFIFMIKNNDTIKTPGFYVSLDWYETIMELKDEEAGILLKNMYNYSLELPLLETNGVVKAISNMVVFKTIDINKQKYIEKCEKNRVNGGKGGRPAGSKKINPEKPNGLIENPEKPKSNINTNNKNKLNLEVDTSSRIEQMKKIIAMDLKAITGEDQIDFCIMAKELVKYLDWDRFQYLVFYLPEAHIEEQLNEYGFPDLLTGILEIKENYEYLLDSIIK
jgi:hypothetical protein